jgi:Fur family ferric uptake transcriptional regulator
MSRNTQAKKKILEFIQSSPQAVSHAAIFGSLQELCDRVTIYRVLERLVNENKIHKIVNVDGVINYATCHSCTNIHYHNHVHFSCEKCKAITCLEENEITFSLPPNYLFKESFFTVSGVCPACN